MLHASHRNAYHFKWISFMHEGWGDCFPSGELYHIVFISVQYTRPLNSSIKLGGRDDLVDYVCMDQRQKKERRRRSSSIGHGLPPFIFLHVVARWKSFWENNFPFYCLLSIIQSPSMIRSSNQAQFHVCIHGYVHTYIPHVCMITK